MGGYGVTIVHGAVRTGSVANVMGKFASSFFRTNVDQAGQETEKRNCDRSEREKELGGNRDELIRKE